MFDCRSIIVLSLAGSRQEHAGLGEAEAVPSWPSPCPSSRGLPCLCPMPAAVVSVEDKRYVQDSVNSKFREFQGELHGTEDKDTKSEK